MTERVKSSIIVFTATIVAAALVILPLYLPHIRIITEAVLLANFLISFVLFCIQFFLYKKKPVLPALLISSTLINFAALVFCSASIYEHTFSEGILYLLTSFFAAYDSKYVLLGCCGAVIVMSFFVFGISLIPFTLVEKKSKEAFDKLHEQLGIIDSLGIQNAMALTPDELKKNIHARAHYLFCLNRAVALINKFNYIEYIVGIIILLFFCFIAELQNRGVMMTVVQITYLVVSLINACTAGALLKNRRRNAKTVKLRII